MERTIETLKADCLNYINTETGFSPVDLVNNEVQECLDFLNSKAGTGLTEEERLDHIEFELNVLADNYIDYIWAEHPERF